MSPPFGLFLTSLFLSLLSLSLSQQPPKGYLIDCGAAGKSEIDGREWLPDDDFISTGRSINLTVPGLVPTLSTVRSFPLQNNLRRKFCYVARVYRDARYLIRTTYYYGGVNGLNFPSPPVFDQIVDGTFWSVVNTTEDYQKGLSSYNEGVFKAKGNTMSVCIAPNTYTESDPFISSLEMLILGDSLYNTTDFDSLALSLVARHSFGHNGSIIRYPDDQFDRYWEPYDENVSVISSNNTPPVSGFWNVPPSKVFERALSTAQSEPLELRWPPLSIPNSNYYIALYFADNSDPMSSSSRVLDIHINDVRYYGNLNVTSEGAAVFATRWPLGGRTKITLSPAANSNSPLINAGEIFDVLRLGGRTHTRDARALEDMKNSLHNHPLDWNGDPCLPLNYSWTGVTCSEGERIRVIALNLTSMGLAGSLSPSIANLTALSGIWLGNNSLSGVIPDLSSLMLLEILHMEDNQLSGEIPSSLGDLGRLRELFLQNNNLTGSIPDSLVGRSGLEVRTSGNQFLSPPPS
ncbi:putative leucine-rich repeat receptor-like serine/threonine-protein kinase At2g14440 [Herrania umbratica]|uniref:Leucine-rich repeat receptor-like serine/threonine-protein kinase At2g14440 n=1 Tax=Herrania umbratica TaxID=108875 RepID=A0A6J1AWR2_9ROSI|nr:putative leucine-rich repeat receptor-like serine/threonine-protein kinase At2g14440 [Herrania umbratica]